MFRWVTFMCKITKIMSVMSLKYKPVTQFTLCLIFLMCVATMHHYTTVDQYLKISCSLHDSNIPVTLKRGQGHKI